MKVLFLENMYVFYVERLLAAFRRLFRNGLVLRYWFSGTTGPGINHPALITHDARGRAVRIDPRMEHWYVLSTIIGGLKALFINSSLNTRMSPGVHADLPEAAKKDKYTAIASNVFRFYRGTNHLYWKDSANDARLQKYGGSKETLCWVGGDLHPENFGTFWNGKKKVVYSLNDFDDSIVADYQMDVLRLTAGIVLMARVNGHLGGKDKKDEADKLIVKHAVDPFLNAYADEIILLAESQPPVEEVKDLTSKTAEGPIAKLLAKMEKKQPSSVLEKSCKRNEQGVLDFDYSNYAKYQPASEEDRAKIFNGLVWDYKKHVESIGPDEEKAEAWNKVRQIARRAGAGTGSLGLERYVVLVQGRGKSDNASRILDVKTQPLPQPFQYLSAELKKAYEDRFAGNHARRMVHGTRALSLLPDKHLGWFAVDSSDAGDNTMMHFSVKEVTAFKGGLETAEDIVSKEDHEITAKQWGKLLARAHYRTKGHNYGGAEDPSKGIAAKIGKDKCGFVEHLKSWGFEYAGVVAKDYEEFKANALLLALVPRED